MTLIDDFATALESYPVDSTNVRIVDVTGPGQVNTGDVFTFQVRIVNDGHINMTGVSLHVAGRGGALVGTSNAGPFDGSMTVEGLTVDGESTRDTANLFFKAPDDEQPAGTVLVEAHIAEWSGDLNELFENHTNHAIFPSGTYSARVFPS